MPICFAVCKTHYNSRLDWQPVPLITCSHLKQLAEFTAQKLHLNIKNVVTLHFPGVVTGSMSLRVCQGHFNLFSPFYFGFPLIREQ